VHLHTSGTTAPSPSLLNLGEIAVQHASEESCLYIKNQDGELIKFIPSGTIQTMIDNVSIDCGFYGTGTTHEYVDLGLPSGTLWATENIKNDNGDDLYFAWGEVSGYSSSQVGIVKNFDWTSNNGVDGYVFGPYNSSDSTNLGMTKYNKTDGKTILEPEDDAATANWGSDWCMPNNTQFYELENTDNTTTAWTQVNGINGMLFTSKFNGNTLFLPADGLANKGKFYEVNTAGRYWTSIISKYISSNSGYLYILSNKNGDICEVRESDRYNGHTIRPVRKTS
jgi:hypothetical protein